MDCQKQLFLITVQAPCETRTGSQFFKVILSRVFHHLTKCAPICGWSHERWGYPKKAVELDPIHCKRHGLKNLADRERTRWAELCNKSLERAGVSTRVDHRSLEAQGTPRVAGVHLGPNVVRMESRGLRTDRGDAGCEIEKQNEEVRRISAQIIDLGEVRGRMESERDRARTGAPGDFVRAPLTGKEKEAVREGRAVPSKEEAHPVGDDHAERLHIKVPYEEKDTAKAKGARWDVQKRSWYVPAGEDLAGFEKW
ncbi:MAG: DUF5710 domain-containing protein [Syntrophobacteraceae bacterium]|nr:DUF5710 domain-containing protein [Syntrophobacteraceae bacterium]